VAQVLALPHDAHAAHALRLRLELQHHLRGVVEVALGVFASSSSRSRCSSEVMRMGSTDLIRNGSIMVRGMASSGSSACCHTMAR
jgi:hypothetical protein